MKTLILDHPYTPTPLKKINQDLMAVLSAKEPDEVEFLSLVEMRDDTIQAWLNDVSQTDKIPFIEAEMIANGALVAYTELLFKASLKQLTGLVRGRKAVKKYI